MSVNFKQQQTKESKFPIIRILIWLFILAAIFVAWFFLSKKINNTQTQNYTANNTNTKKIEINLDILKNPVFNSLQDFQNVPEFEGKIGRDNPFK